jgi:hypothetical protein
MQNYSMYQGVSYPAEANGYGALSAGGGIGKPMCAATHPRRKKLNILSLFISFGVPFMIFVGLLTLLTSRTRYYYPLTCFTTTFGTGLVVLAIGYQVVTSIQQRTATGEGEPTWLIFLFGSSLVAYICAVCLGENVYEVYMQPYHRIMGMGTYTSVDPRTSSGQVLMDAGRVVFTNSSHLDVTKAMGYKGLQMYCVAPITMDNATLSTYDFWAVGTDCCTADHPNFHCGEFHNPKVHAGLRFMGESDDGKGAMFRLGVKQAEARYKIKSQYPIFVTWAQDPIGDTDQLYDDGSTICHNGVFGYFCFQLALVFCAASSFNSYR